jgi:hypothetical protein
LHPTIKMSHNGIWFPICFNFNITNWKKSLLLIGFIQMLPLFTRTPASISFMESSLRHCSFIVSRVRLISVTICKNTMQTSESLKQSSPMVIWLCLKLKWSDFSISMSFT